MKQIIHNSELKTLHAGILTAQFENGWLRYIRCNGREVVRGLYFALRDHNWGTVPYHIEDHQAEILEDAFEITFAAVHSVDGKDVFRWQVNLSGTSDSSIIFDISGQALQPFRRNRAGFCLLHPVEECAGKPVAITQTDDSTMQTFFPDLISPHRPFPYLTAMQWEIADGVAARVEFEGDEFETEDHRNWTDTSYKTFCTPLAKPYPVDLQPGDEVRQTVRLALPGPFPPAQKEATGPVCITVLDTTRLMPCIGTQQPFAQKTLQTQAVERLRALRLDHYRIEVEVGTQEWFGWLEEGYRTARAIGAKLLLALTMGEDVPAATDLFLEAVRRCGFAPFEVILFQKHTYATPSDLLHVAIPKLRAVLGKNWRIGAGVQTNYAELGRNPFDAAGLDFVVYGIQPQEHAFDDASLIENLESQADTVRSARAMYPNQKVYVSPLTLRKRFNPYAQHEADRFVEHPAVAQTDPRQTTDFGAGWLLGSLKSLAETDTDAVTVFRACGDGGLLTTDGTPHPAYHLLLAVQAFAGGTVRLTRSSDKLVCSSLLLEKDGRKALFLANHTAQLQKIAGDGWQTELAPHEGKRMDW